MIKLMRGNHWDLEKVIPDKGQPVYDSDANNIKVGDGESSFKDLDYLGIHCSGSSYPCNLISMNFENIRYDPDTYEDRHLDTDINAWYEQPNGIYFGVDIAAVGITAQPFGEYSGVQGILIHVSDGPGMKDFIHQTLITIQDYNYGVMIFTRSGRAHHGYGSTWDGGEELGSGCWSLVTPSLSSLETILTVNKQKVSEKANQEQLEGQISMDNLEM